MGLTGYVTGTFSLALQAAGEPNGGADGSILVDPNEVLRTENNGLQNIVSLLSPLPAKFGVSAGDVLHLAGVLGVVRLMSISCMFQLLSDHRAS